MLSYLEVEKCLLETRHLGLCVPVLCRSRLLVLQPHLLEQGERRGLDSLAVAQEEREV